MLRTLDRYVFRRLLGSLVPTCLGLGFLFFVGAGFRLLRDHDLSLQQVLLAIPWVVPFLLPYLVPVALVITITFVYGRMVADNEVLAFGSLGIPGRALAWPAIAIAAALALGTTWVTAQLVPFCHRMQKEATRAVFEQLFDLGEGEHLTLSFPRQHLSLYVRRYAPGALEGVVVHVDRELGGSGRRVPMQLVAERGRVAEESRTRELVLVLSGVTATILPDPEALAALGTPGPEAARAPGPIRIHLDQYVQSFELGERRRYKVFDYATPELRRQADAAARREALAVAVGGLGAVWEGTHDVRLEAEVELAMRTVLSAAPLLVTLLVLPITLLVDARSPLVAFAAGLAATLTLFFTPLLVGSSLASASDSAAGVYSAIATTLGGAALAAWLAARRG